MSFWVLVQTLVDLILLAGCGLLWVRLHRPPKDDPRLSKGLQLLQSKIAVLEDLSDRTEVQVTQLTALLETKCREIQEKIGAADRQIARIESSAQKSMEVASIFQDRIPHSEILERQNTIKYVTAARMAHQGHSVDEIAAQVDLSRAELEFIAKVNREQLQFSEADLPEWARAANPTASSAQAKKHGPAPSEVQFSLPRQSFSHEQNFMEIDLRSPDANRSPVVPAPKPQSQPQRQQQPVAAAKAPVAPATTTAQTSRGQTVEVRPVLFPRIEN